MKVDFSNKTPSTPVEVEASVTAVEAVAAESVSVPATVKASGAVDFLSDTLPGFSDIILPRVNVVQFSGELKNTFTPGEIVFNQSLVLFTPPVFDKQTNVLKSPASPPVNLTILGFRKTRFVEKVAGGARGASVRTEAEVIAAGGTLDWNEWNLKKSHGMKLFEHLAEAFVAIRRPAHAADDESVFTYHVGEDKYALGVWGLKGSAYRNVAKKIFFTARTMGCLKNGYPSWSYNITTGPKTYNGNTYILPIAIPDKPSTPAFLEFVQAILSAPESTSSEE